MFSKKKTECRVCGYRFTPERENIYTAEEPRSALEMLAAAPTRFRKAGIAAARYSAIRLTDARLASGFKRLSRKRGGGVSDCFTYPSADGHGIFSRLHLRESGNPLRARAATVHGRRRERRRSRALPFNGSYL